MVGHQSHPYETAEDYRGPSLVTVQAPTAYRREEIGLVHHNPSRRLNLMTNSPVHACIY